MKLSKVTDSILKRMRPSERKKLGAKVQTSEQAMDKFVARNERELQNHICNLLRVRGIAFQVCRMDKRTTGAVGWPDITFALDGRACALEVKFEGGKVSAEQLQCHAAMKKDGWRVAVVKTVDEARMFLIA